MSVIFRGRVFTLEQRAVKAPGKRTINVDVIVHPGAVAIVPIVPGNALLMVKQFRPSIGQWLLEIPAGTREKGEATRVTAQREIREEIGHRARTIRSIGGFYTAPGFCTEWIEIFVAKGLVPDAAEQDSDEILRPQRVSYAQALRMIRDGRIRDAKTIAGLNLAARYFT